MCGFLQVTPNKEMGIGMMNVEKKYKFLLGNDDRACRMPDLTHNPVGSGENYNKLLLLQDLKISPVVQPRAKDPADDTSEDTSKDTSKEHTGETTERIAEDPAEGHADGSGENPAKNPTEEHTEEHSQKQAKDATNDHTKDQTDYRVPAKQIPLSELVYHPTHPGNLGMCLMIGINSW